MPVFPRIHRQIDRIHERPDWPTFRWDYAAVSAPLANVRHLQGRLIGQMEALGVSRQKETGLRDVDDAVLVEATLRYEQPLTQERLFGWHARLFPTGPSGMYRITMAPRFEAPAASRLDDEMRRFLEWFNTDATMEPVLKAALAHLWFVTIHPFDDGNGRIARAIADMALARSENSPQRFYSMSAQIREERADYYRILEQTQRGTLDVTPWMQWFLACLTRAIEGAQVTLSGVLTKARFWEKLRDVSLNDRQRLVINKLLEGFEGKLTTSKWAALTKSSQDTALRDIQQLVERGVLVRNAAGGRSTSYALRTPEAL